MTYWDFLDKHIVISSLFGAAGLATFWVMLWLTENVVVGWVNAKIRTESTKNP